MNYMLEVQMNGGRCLYSDTDSLITWSPTLHPPLKTGNTLGEMSLEHPERRLLEYVGTGAKQYALRWDHNGQEVFDLKLRGITLDYATSSLINYNNFKQMAMEQMTGERPQVTIQYQRIRPQILNGGSVRTLKEIKTYKPVHNKGFRVKVSSIPLDIS